jgi:hypothetical protein
MSEGKGHSLELESETPSRAWAENLLGGHDDVPPALRLVVPFGQGGSLGNRLKFVNRESDKDRHFFGWV